MCHQGQQTETDGDGSWKKERKRKEEKESKPGHQYLRKEYNYHSFVRSFTLGEKQIQSDKIQAQYTDGILHITLPKSPEAKSRAARLIPVS